MTAQVILNNTLPLISGMKVEKDKDFDTLLTHFNFAKNRIARDTLLWIGGETITLTEENIYTLSTLPLQIIEVYDDSLQIRPRNTMNYLGYTQISPNQIHVNTPEVGVVLNINYYEEPEDYTLVDEVLIPKDLIEAMQHYVAYRVYSVYKSEKEDSKKALHLQEYNKLVDEYLSKTDMNDLNSIEETDLIYQKGLI